METVEILDWDFQYIVDTLNNYIRDNENETRDFSDVFHEFLEAGIAFKQQAWMD